MTEPTPDEIERQRTALWADLHLNASPGDISEAVSECSDEMFEKICRAFHVGMPEQLGSLIMEQFDIYHKDYVEQRLQDWIDQYPETVKERLLTCRK